MGADAQGVAVNMAIAICMLSGPRLTAFSCSTLKTRIIPCSVRKFEARTTLVGWLEQLCIAVSPKYYIVVSVLDLARPSLPPACS